MSVELITRPGRSILTLSFYRSKRKRNESGDEEANSILNLDKLDTNALLKLQGEQLERFESYRRSAIPRVAMKKVLSLKKEEENKRKDLFLSYYGTV